MTVRRGVRLGAPIAFAALLLADVPIAIPDAHLAIAAVRGLSIVWLALGVAALMRWPRLWVLAPCVVLTRVAISFGAPRLFDWVESGAIPLVVLPLLLVGCTSALRRRPAADPGARGRLAPNPEGSAALVVMVAAVALGVWEHFIVAAVLIGAAAAVGLVLGIATPQPPDRRAHWAAVIVCMIASTGYVLYWARPDWGYGSVLAAKTAAVAGVTLWAILRAFVPAGTPALATPAEPGP